MEKWKLLSSKIRLDSPWLRVHENSYELPNNKAIIPQYYITERNDSALCVCYTGSHFVIVKQYRPAIDKVTFCHPGGRIEEDDKLPVDGALRELLEETGYCAEKVVNIGSYAQIPAVTTSKVHIFLVFCKPLALQPTNLDETEEIEQKLISADQLQHIIDSGDMDCVACVAASYRALRYLGLSSK